MVTTGSFFLLAPDSNGKPTNLYPFLNLFLCTGYMCYLPKVIILLSKNHTLSYLQRFCMCYGPMVFQTFCQGQMSLRACANLVPGMMYLLGMTRGVSWNSLVNLLTALITWPIAKMLNWVLGTKEQHTYNKSRIQTFLQFHWTGDEPLWDYEIPILNGGLELNMKKVEAMILLQVSLLSNNEIFHTSPLLTDDHYFRTLWSLVLMIFYTIWLCMHAIWPWIPLWAFPG